MLLIMTLPEFFSWKVDVWRKHFNINIEVNVFNNLPIRMENQFLLEAINFSNKYYVSSTPRENYKICLEKEFVDYKENTLKDVSLCLMTTPEPHYMDMLYKTIEHFRFIDNINVVFYGSETNIEGINSVYYNDEFHMSQARNRSLDLSKTPVTLQIDTGFLLSEIDILDCIKDLNHNNIIHLKKNHRTGNGNYIGITNTMLGNRYDERFKYFYFEDTEYLMNYSRNGFIPLVKILNINELPHEKVNHSKPKITREGSLNNKKLFSKILKEGR
jgi:hypothetical protein